MSKKKKNFGKFIVFCQKAKRKYIINADEKICPACGELITSEGHIISEDEKQ